MAHFAKVIDGIVTQVIVAEQDFIDTGILGDPSSWFQTSYNTHSGIHYDPNSGQPSQEQYKAKRKNFAGIGYHYLSDLDIFLPPKPYPSWIVDVNTGLWKAPVEYPSDNSKDWQWNELTNSWE